MDPELSIYENMMDEIILYLQGDQNRPAFAAMGVEVQKMKQFTGDYEKLEANRRSRIQIGWLQDRFGTDESGTETLVGEPRMDRGSYYQFNVAARHLFGKHGTLRIQDLVQRMMLGFKSKNYPGETFAFAATVPVLDDSVWYGRVVTRHRYAMLKPLNSFRTTGEEDLGGNLVEATFTPEILQ